MPTYSYSRISTFEGCRLQFKYHYIDRLETEQEETVETFLGSLVHEALERLYKDLQHQKKDTKEEILDWFRSEWTKRWNPDTMKIVRAEYAAENYRQMGEKYLGDYYDRYAPFDQGRTIGLETEELLDLGEAYQYHIRIDRLVDSGKGVYEIHDYKTGGSMRTQDELEGDRQLAMYAYWVHRSYPDAKSVRLVWHFLAFDKEMAVEKRIDHLEQLKNEVLGKIREIESCTEFPPTKSGLCEWCAYQRFCPLWKHLFETEELSPEQFKREDGVNLVNEYAELKEKEEKLKENIERVQQKIYSYADQHSAQMVYGSTSKVNVWSKEVVKLPNKGDPSAKVLAQLLRAQGLYDEYSTVDTWRLGDALTSGRIKIEGYNPPKERVRRLYLSKR
jgi:putative RecB family exonuclease